jgi:hypothetical protein
MSSHDVYIRYSIQTWVENDWLYTYSTVADARGGGRQEGHPPQKLGVTLNRFHVQLIIRYYN